LDLTRAFCDAGVLRVRSLVLALWLAGCAGSLGDGGAGSGGGESTGAGGGEDESTGGSGGGGGSGATDPGPIAGEDPSVAGIVAAHNAARAAVQPAPATPLPPLSWSDAAFDKASAWASNCHFGHNPDLGDFGENIFATSGVATAREVVQTWVGEAGNYDYATNACRGECGHYTQVVWRSTTSVGCAVKTCTTGSPFDGGTWRLWVCDYAPAGNSGGRPY
jgi:pathogenesis-related protein 1